MAELDPPSPFATRHRRRLREAAGRARKRGLCVDLACGRGRHTLFQAAGGANVLAVDRNREPLVSLLRDPPADGGRIWAVLADVEDPRGLPIRAGVVSLLIITRFLHRESCGRFADLLMPGGVLLYETFLARQRELGRGPRSADFLLEEGELPTLFPGLEVLDFEEGLREAPQREWVASLLARRPLDPTPNRGISR